MAKATIGHGVSHHDIEAFFIRSFSEVNMSDEWRSRLPTVESQFAFLKLQSIDSGKLEHLKAVFGAKMKELELKEDEDIDEPSAMLILKDFEKDLTVKKKKKIIFFFLNLHNNNI